MEINKLENIIKNYKSHIREHGLSDEIYKWELLSEFRGRPNVDAPNLEEELKGINFANLIYGIGKAVSYHIARDRTERYRACFKVLLDDTKPLEDRIKYFTSETLKIYRELNTNKKESHHQDERTMATFLTFYDPEQYAFYKNSFYKKYCALLGIKAKKKNEKYVHYMDLLNEFIEKYIRPDHELIKLVQKNIPDGAFKDPNFKLLAQDILYRCLDKNIGRVVVNKEEEEDEKTAQASPSYSLNQLLYGPPGTGKTFHTINRALEITNPSFNLNQDRAAIKKEFDRLLQKGQIVFMTFHQSMSYEDFVEGIKPLEPEQEGNPIVFKVIDGIFKEISERALNYKKYLDRDSNTAYKLKERVDIEQSAFYKMSLGNTQLDEDGIIYQYCIENDCVSLGYGQSIDYSELEKIEELLTAFKEKGLEPESSYELTAVRQFRFWMQEGDIVFISDGNYKVRAIGIINGPYQFKPDTVIHYNHFRPVRWLLTDVEIPVNELYKKNLSQQTIYGLNKKLIIKDFFHQKNVLDPESKNHVLIIDEINRGNIAEIFGELITLLESDKRLGNAEALEVKLPYSKKLFGVPNNLYIIGTMNTADRSIEALDTALRRRFTFEEMPPNPELIKEESDNDGVVDDIYLVQLLETINARIEKLLDRDHLIGHSYFLNVETIEDLKTIFYKNIIPLLQEYFFGDYGKIGLVLGAGFVQEKEEQNVFASSFNYETQGLEDRKVYQIRDYRVEELETKTEGEEKSQWDFSMAIQKLLE